MAKEYQPKTKKYSLPHNVYMQMVYMVRDYERMKAEYKSLLDETPPPFKDSDGLAVDPTAEKAIRREDLYRRLKAVESGLASIPEEYRPSIYNNVVYRIRYDDRYTSYRTYGYHKAKMMWTIAHELRM